MFRQPKNHILPLSSLLLNLVKRRQYSYPIFSNFYLTLQDLSNEEPIPRLKKIHTRAEVKKFCSGLEEKLIVEKKIDGVSCYLVYRKGYLVKATTKYGWSIMGIVRTVKSIPKRIDRSFSGGVRGELYITKRKFISLNRQRIDKGLHVYKSPITAIMNSGKIRNNKVEFHGFLLNTQTHLRTQLAIMRELKQLGINGRGKNFHKSFELPQDFDALCRYVQTIEERRNEFASNIDGLVIKANLLTSQRIERKVVAFKYDSMSLK
jgi:DNA ligase (NAD+)